MQSIQAPKRKHLNSTFHHQQYNKKSRPTNQLTKPKYKHQLPLRLFHSLVIDSWTISSYPPPPTTRTSIIIIVHIQYLLVSVSEDTFFLYFLLFLLFSLEPIFLLHSQTLHTIHLSLLFFLFDSRQYAQHNCNFPPFPPSLLIIQFF